MRIDRFTSALQSAVAEAQSLAIGKDHQFIEPVHLLMALLRQQNGSVKPLLQQAGVNLPTLEQQLGELQEQEQEQTCCRSCSHANQCTASVGFFTAQIRETGFLHRTCW